MSLRNSLLPLLLILSSLTTAPAVRAVDLDSLLIVSIGGDAAYDSLAKVESYQIEGEVALNGLPGRFTMYWVAPDLFRLDVDFEQFSMVQAFDGSIAWKRDLNGMTTELGGFEEKELLKQIYFQSFAYLFDGRVPGSIGYGGTETIDGVTYHRVVARPLNDDSTVIYLDTETGRQHLTISSLDNIVTRTVSGDYRTVNGILMPYYSESTAEGVPVRTEFQIESVEFNVPIDRGLFVSEQLAPSDFHFPAGQESVKLPIRYNRGHLYIEASINGQRRALFLLDSGASANIFDNEILQGLEIEELGTIAAKGIGGYEEVTRVRIDSLKIGALTLLGQIGGRMNLQQLIKDGLNPGDSKLPIGGVLGHEFLSRFPILLNYQAGVATVYNPDGFVPDSGGAVMPFHRTLGIPTIEANLVGIPGDFIIDLGNPFGVILHEKFVTDNNLEASLDDIRRMSGSVGGVGGSSNMRSAYAATFGFGDVRIQSLRVLLPEGSAGLTGSEEIAGNIGNLVLEGFRVLFDYAGSRVIFYPVEQ